MTDPELERVAVLAEELGESMQAVGKVLRHGFDDWHPDTGEVNRHALERELADVFVAVELMLDAGDFDRERIAIRRQQKAVEIRKWLKHQGGAHDDGGEVGR